VPRMLHAQGLDELICAKLQLHTKPANLTRWDKLVDEVEHPKHDVTIAMCG
jgi:CTP synthase